MSCNWRADLHVHSIHSDGALSVNQLILLAQEKGLDAISITDHDSLDAYRSLSCSESKETFFQIITGIELSCQYRGESVHLLGYRFSPQDPLMQSWEKHHKKVRRKRAQRYFDFWESKFDISPTLREEFFYERGNGVVTRSHLASFFIKKKLARNLNHFLRFYVNCCSLENEFAFPFIEDAIDLLHKVGGYAVLAHPYTISSHVVDSAFLQLPFDGVELFHHGRFVGEFWESWSRKRKLFITGGSDFHDPKRGHVIGDSTIDWETGSLLLNPSRSSEILQLPYLSAFDHNIPLSWGISSVG